MRNEDHKAFSPIVDSSLSCLWKSRGQKSRKQNININGSQSKSKSAKKPWKHSIEQRLSAPANTEQGAKSITRSDEEICWCRKCNRLRLGDRLPGSMPGSPLRVVPPCSFASITRKALPGCQNCRRSGTWGQAIALHSKYRIAHKEAVESHSQLYNSDGSKSLKSQAHHEVPGK